MQFETVLMAVDRIVNCALIVMPSQPAPQWLPLGGVSKGLPDPQFERQGLSYCFIWNQDAMMSIDREVDKEDVVHIHNGILHSH